MPEPVQSPSPLLTERKGIALAIVLVRRGQAEAASRALRQAYGLDLPAPGRLTSSGPVILLWSGPDRFLAVRDGEGPALTDWLGGPLRGLAHVAEASDSRVILRVSGQDAPEALNRFLPIDLHERAFTPGSVALTVAGHLSVQVWRPGDAPCFDLACPSSYAESFRDRLGVICGRTQA